jgi:copper homeostasis protein
MTVLVEACVDSAAAARRAVQEGAGRLEVCGELAAGGTTPAPSLLRAIREQVAIPVHVLIRPRPGDFRFAEAEIGRMLAEMAESRRLGADGLVVGALAEDGGLDRPALRRLLEAAGPLAVTFHRAFDELPDPVAALAELAGLGVTRVLTSGGAPTAAAGIPLLARLVREARGRIGILAAGSIRAGNAARIVTETGVREVHLAAGESAEAGRVAGVVNRLRS